MLPYYTFSSLGIVLMMRLNIYRAIQMATKHTEFAYRRFQLFLQPIQLSYGSIVCAMCIFISHFDGIDGYMLWLGFALLSKYKHHIQKYKKFSAMYDATIHQKNLIFECIVCQKDISNRNMNFMFGNQFKWLFAQLNSNKNDFLEKKKEWCDV